MEMFLARFPLISKHFFLFVVFSMFFQVFGPPRRSKLELKLNLVLGGILEGSWSYYGKVLGDQDAPITAQDGAKMCQDGAETAQDS